MKRLNGLFDFLGRWRSSRDMLPFLVLFRKFRSILERNNKILELMSDMGDKLGGEYVFDRQYIKDACEMASDNVFKLISDLCILTKSDNVELFVAFERIQHELHEELSGRRVVPTVSPVISIDNVNGDFKEEVGNKFAVIGDIKSFLGLPTPDGFVFTTKAFFDFMEYGGHLKYAQKLLASWRNEELPFDAICDEIVKRILSSPIPKDIIAGMNSALKAISKKHKGEELMFAVRSSAWGEDSGFSFAGQYESVLNVSKDGIPDAYRKVVASAYTHEAWHYRLHRGFREHEMAMAVGCQLMVSAVASGAMYTYAPLPLEKEAMVISSAWGLGPAVVQGTAESDMFILDRMPPHKVLSEEVDLHKDKMLVSDSSGGTVWKDTPERLRRRSSLSPYQIEYLAQSAMNIERYYKRPQDVEWAFDDKGELYILQARPLNIRPEIPQARTDVGLATRSAEIIFSGKGTVVQQGVASGKVYIALKDDDLNDFPYGSILVTRHTSPKYGRVMPRAHGIITDIGSPTGHMATLAREYRIPAIVGTDVATGLLETGDEITMDATRNTIYRGSVKELTRFELAEQEVFEETYEYRLLKRLLRKIYPLHLVDSRTRDFRPEKCLTFHDITRYVHEKAVEKLIDLSENYQKYHDRVPKRFKSKLPLGLMVIDIDGGLDAPQEAKTVALENIASMPLKALLEGLVNSGMWGTEPVSMDIGSFMSSLTRTLVSTHSSQNSSTERNLAVVSREYMNLNLKLGYHYTVVNAFIDDEPNDNYVFFRFMGGVTDFGRRSRRARFIAGILEHLDFLVELHGDLVAGRLKKMSKERMCSRTMIIGALIGYTRQLDVEMATDSHIAHFHSDFLEKVKPMMEAFNGRA
ncbi:PEP/pyruvate-binding domain-containing protein [Desulforegula conservatrix]|uniref:PEP/pyruvate-binding domain-containing protein n=1 Tax=Desulforegula conservatrix TaxID=153026 RepID=UPI0004004BDA|nr:PEP/pyruvate-binding domain-containing protein [Desulforegula conservatrix]